jgi:formate-dependent nitrite reductase cytochrome c552 subunit
MNTPTDQNGDSLRKELEKLKTEVAVVDQWTDKHGNVARIVKNEKLSSAMIDQIMRLILSDREKAQLDARIDEQNHLGFDKRLDNPILYCEGDKVISQDERLAQLRKEQS